MKNNMRSPIKYFSLLSLLVIALSCSSQNQTTVKSEKLTNNKELYFDNRVEKPRGDDRDIVTNEIKEAIAKYSIY